MNAEDTKRLVLEFFTDLTAGRLDKAWQMLAEDAVWTLMASSPSYPFDQTYDKAGYRALIERSAGLFPGGLTLTLKDAIAERDRVAIEAESLGTAFNGKRYNNVYHFRVELKNGKIAAIREYLDSGLVVDVLGPREHPASGERGDAPQHR